VRLDVEAHRHLLANCFSQGLALMQGHTDVVQPSRAISGNRPSNTLLVKELNPYNLGALLALYEHKVYVQSVVWDINAFDQWGVELGKQLSRDVYTALAKADGGAALDASTANLIAAVKDWNR
jgi:glucose-6-phosphate isomerase